MNVLFASQIDASRYVAGAGLVKGANVRTIDFEANTVRFSLVNADDSVRSEVNGIAGSEPFTMDTDFAAVISAEIASK